MYTANATEMRAIRMKAAKFIHKQKVKGGTLPAGDVFDESEVYTADIVDGEYYDLPESAFYMVGGIEEAVEKARKMAVEAA